MEKKRAYKGHMIKKIEEGSIAQELGLVPGDWLLAINGQQIRDIFDYQYEIQEGYVELLIEKTDGEQWL